MRTNKSSSPKCHGSRNTRSWISQYSLGRARWTPLSPRILGFITTGLVSVTREKKISRRLRSSYVLWSWAYARYAQHPRPCFAYPQRRLQRLGREKNTTRCREVIFDSVHSKKRFWKLKSLGYWNRKNLL